MPGVSAAVHARNTHRQSSTCWRWSLRTFAGLSARPLPPSAPPWPSGQKQAAMWVNILPKRWLRALLSPSLSSAARHKEEIHFYGCAPNAVALFELWSKWNLLQGWHRWKGKLGLSRVHLFSHLMTTVSVCVRVCFAALWQRNKKKSEIRSRQPHCVTHIITGYSGTPPWMSPAILGLWLWLRWEGQLCLAEVRSGDCQRGGSQKLVPGWTLLSVPNLLLPNPTVCLLCQSGSHSRVTHTPPFHLALTCATEIQNWIAWSFTLTAVQLSVK